MKHCIKQLCNFREYFLKYGLLYTTLNCTRSCVESYHVKHTQQQIMKKNKTKQNKTKQNKIIQNKTKLKQKQVCNVTYKL